MNAPAQFSGLEFYGLDLSYFTGKVEAYLRYQEIPHRRIELDLRTFRRVARETGLAQMPAVRLPDGRWMSDSTPIIEFIDAAFPAPHVVPEDPVRRFFSQLIEDYADEWLWRPALHYRWSYEPDARLMSHRIAAEMMRDLPIPLRVRRGLILRRQIRKYVKGDGVTVSTRGHVEDIYKRNLAFLQAIFETRPFMLGGRPTLADFGYFASMFRHFGLDPTPARIMRDTAPAVYEWLGRMWNAKRSRLASEPVIAEGIPADWMPILRDAAACYVPYLNANATAWKAGKRRFSVIIEDFVYHLPVHPYRVWCLERLQSLFRGLPGGAQATVNGILAEAGLWPCLFEAADLESGFDPQRRAPFFRGSR